MILIPTSCNFFSENLFLENFEIKHVRPRTIYEGERRGFVGQLADRKHTMILPSDLRIVGTR